MGSWLFNDGYGYGQYGRCPCCGGCRCQSINANQQWAMLQSVAAYRGDLMVYANQQAPQPYNLLNYWAEDARNKERERLDSLTPEKMRAELADLQTRIDGFVSRTVSQAQTWR